MISKAHVIPFLFTTMCIFLRDAHGACDGKIVGTGCQFQCHCRPSTEVCDGTTGACQSGCDFKWAGPACQHRNYANAVTTQDDTKHSSTSGAYAYKANDGNIDTCSRTPSITSTATKLWWKIWIGRDSTNKRVQGLAMNTDYPADLRWFVVYVSTASTTDQQTGKALPADLQLCHNNGASIVTNPVDVRCHTVLSGDLIIIQIPSAYRPARIALCEVAIYGECDPGRHGDSCLDTCGHCSGGTTTCDTISGDCPENRCSAGWQGDRCDTECALGSWGSGCLGSCGYCLSGTCSNANGHCNTSGCQPGYKTTVLCIEECDDQTYGIGCSGNCSNNCKDGASCNTTDGRCPGGVCTPGWQGQRCDQVCDIGYWGPGCGEPCGYCLSRTCNHVVGYCNTEGCQPGYKTTDMCIEECDDQTYGIGCSGNCSNNCKDGASCNTTAGHCPGGVCKPGWQGQKCDQVCGNWTYGLGCQYGCGKCNRSGVCSSIDGTCLGGCLSNWHGLQCQMYKGPDDPKPVAAIVAGVIVIVIAIVVCITAILIAKRRRRARKADEKGNPHKPVSYLEDDNHDGTFVNPVVLSDEHGPQVTSDTAQYANCTIHVLQSDTRDTANENVKTEPQRAPSTVEYGNVSTKNTTAVALADLRLYIYQHAIEDKFTKEFSKLPVGLQSPTEAASLSANRSKNRYKSMYPYDYNIVKLKIRKDHSHSDYINASYINGFGKVGAFIAAQGPTKKTTDDFLRMLWEAEIKVIVMLTGCIEDGSRKCQQYWPDTGERKHDNLTIAMVTEEVFPDFTIRSLEISKGRAERRIIQHFQFTAWSDKLVPAEPFGMVQFHRKLKSSISGQEEPVLVHCSAGVGRTGTFIAFALLYDEGKSTGCIGILPCVQELRRQRVLMVQTEGQYKFLHEVLYTALVSARPAIAINDFRAAYTLMCELDGTTGRTILDTLFQNVNEDVLRIPDNLTEGTDDSKTDRFKTARMDANFDKNVDQKILVSEQYRPYLLTEVDGCNDYINAVFIPTYTQSKGLIMTQLPLSHTAVDVCRLIYQLGVELVVTFTAADMQDTMLPESVTQHGPFLMKCIATHDEKYFTTREIRLEYNKVSPTKSVKQYIFSRNLEQTDYEAVIALLTTVEAAAKQGNEGVPVVVQCLNGCDQSGVFCVLWNVLERMRIDNEVAIPEIISRARTRREQIISDCEQFKLCHDVILYYIENYLVYSNVSIISMSSVKLSAMKTSAD